MDKLLLVDGSNLLFQMFYGMPARIVNHQGKPIQGTLGFLGALLKMVRLVSPTHLAVLFDGETHNPRSELDENYKANRTDYSGMAEEDTPFSQLPDIFAALEELGIRWAETTDCEFDDWAAAYAAACRPEMTMVLASQDSDFFQLIRENVTVLRYRGDSTVLCDSAWLHSKLGVSPDQYAGYKALTGDSSDNIPGVPKIGPKTAASLMNQFGGLEQLLARTAEIKKPSVRASVEQHRDRAEKNLALIKLQGGQPLPFDLEALRWQYDGRTSTQVLRAIGLRE